MISKIKNVSKEAVREPVVIIEEIAKAIDQCVLIANSYTRMKQRCPDTNRFNYLKKHFSDELAKAVKLYDYRYTMEPIKYTAFNAALIKSRSLMSL